MPTPMTLEEKLAAFRADPVTFMNTVPQKERVDDNADNDVPIEIFSDEAIENLDYVSAGDDHRRALETVETHRRSRAGIANRDHARFLVDKLELTTLESIEAANLKKGSLAESPWSDDYWAIYTGILGKRHADPKFPSDKDWQKNVSYIRDNGAKLILAEGSQKEKNRLSPSEKYDALVGDGEQSFTKSMWAQGKKYHDRYGKVESWMGICHGWAPAAYMLDRPKHAITVKIDDGSTVTFYPSDIKSLASQLWANKPGSTRFIGGRCNDKEPPKDPDNGRVTSQDCFDTNPATWHLSIVNQIGLAKRSMVMDVTFDYEVWNQPVYRYEFTYFNPKTDKSVDDIEAAKVGIEDFSNDMFKKYRSDKTKSVVGVAMKVDYIIETRPNHAELDQPKNDAIKRVEYMYDLELDETGEIIGGEWYNNAHPDFLWTPKPNARATTRYDRSLDGEWKKSIDALPNEWKEKAIASAKDNGTPLAAIVEKLIEFSQKIENDQTEVDNSSGTSTTDNNSSGENTTGTSTTDSQTGNSGSSGSSTTETNEATTNPRGENSRPANNLLEWLRALLRRIFG